MAQSQSTTSDTIQRFLFQKHPIRGQVIQLNQAWRAMIKDRHYPAPLVKLLGELTAFTALLANGLKHPGRITLQIQGSGPVNLLVVEVDHQLNLKGMAKTQSTLTDEMQSAQDLLGDGQILLTLENELNDHLYQSYVTREGDDLTASLEEFLTQSEQLESRLWLAVNDKNIGGLYLQKMPDSQSPQDHEAADADAWDRIQHLAATVKDQELLELDHTTLLTRLFHEEEVSLFEAGSVHYHCPRDRERVAKMIASLGEDEARALLAEQGEIVVYNDMCHYHERFNLDDINQIFKPH